MRLAALCLWLALLSAPAEACSRQWILFFPDGSVAVEGRNQLILAEFARTYFERRQPVSQMDCGFLRPDDDVGVLIFSHAQDRTRDQCGLSERRGYMVRARLAALGIPPERIAVFPLGDRQHMVPAENGQTNPQNRYAELVFAPMVDPAGPPTADGLLHHWQTRTALSCR